MEELAPIYGLLLSSSPMFVVAIVGIAVAGVQWPVARKPALLVMIASVVQLLVLVANALMYGWYLPHAGHDEGFASLRVLMMAWGVATSLLHAVTVSLLIWAAFSGRRPLPTASR